MANLLHVVPRVPLARHDGAAIAMSQLAEGLHSRGHGLTWACLNTDKHYVAPERYPTAWPVHAVPIGLPISAPAALAAALFQRTPYPVLRFLDARFSSLLQALVRAQPYDAIVLDSAYLLPYVWALRAATRAPLVLRAHNLEHRIWQLNANTTANPLKALYWRYLGWQGQRWERSASGEVDAIAAIAPEDAAVFRAWHPQLPVALVRPGVVSTGAPVTVTPPTGLTVGYLGSLNWPPNVAGLRWFVREVWPQVVAQVPGARLVVAGRGAPPEVLGWASATVAIVGEVPDAAAFWAGVQVAVVPVTSGSGVRLKVIEALATGVPVATTPLGAQGATELVGRGLAVGATAEALAGAIGTWLLHPDRRAEAAAEARVAALEYFDMGRQLDALEALLATVTRTDEINPTAV